MKFIVAFSAFIAVSSMPRLFAACPPNFLGEDIHTSFVSTAESGCYVGVGGDIALTVRQTERPTVGTPQRVVGIGHGNGIATVNVTATAHVVISLQLFIARLGNILLNEDFVQRIGQLHRNLL